MSEPPKDIVARVRGGKGTPPGIRFTSGTAHGPFSVGRRGVWRIIAAGVEDTHAYLQFDGRELSVLGLVPQNPPMLEGRPVGAEWTSVATTSILTLGEVRIVVDIDDEDIVLESAPVGVQPLPTRRASAPRAMVDVDLATVVTPHPLFAEVSPQAALDDPAKSARAPHNGAVS